MKRKNQHTILKGEGIHQHTLYGDFEIDETKDEFTDIIIKDDTILKHEQPDGSFGEHKGLQIKQGNWVQGKQVEYNPFSGQITQIFD